MAIRTDFLLKHIRPITRQGYDQFVSNELIDYLATTLHVGRDTLIAAFAAWKTAAESDPVRGTPLFIESARAVAVARWSQLYQTSASTLMFLDANQLASLSQAASNAGPNAQFGWRAPGGIAIAVTIRQDGGYHVQWDVAGFTGATDQNGALCHFVSLR